MIGLLLIGIVSALSILCMSWIIYQAGKEIGWQTGFDEGYQEARESSGDWYEPRPAGR